MKLKSLLIGSAAVMAASATSAKAADAIVMAEPEPMEYVRICDVYGTGFFYIPGTETCMKIGGYYRVDVRYNAASTTQYNTFYQQVNAAGAAVGANTFVNGTRANPAGYNVLARFAPNFDVRSETEWGTLRGFAELEFTYSWSLGAIPGQTFGTTAAYVPPAGSYGTSTNLNHAFIELIGTSGTFRIGKGDLPWTRFLGYGAPGFTYGSDYGFTTIYGNAVEASYTFTGSNGFSGIIAVIDNPVNSAWSTNVEAGVNWAQGWGSIGAMAGYDAVTNTWGAKGAVRFNSSNGAFQVGAMVFYTSGAGSYRVTTGNTTGNVQTNWSALAYARAQLTQTVNVGAWAQWYDNGTWQFRGNVNWTPVENLLIRPEIGYSTGNNSWSGLVRFQRSIP